MTKPLRNMTWLEVTRLLRERVSYETANFDSAFKEEEIVIHGGEVTDFVRARTRLYRETWIDPIVDMLIEREERAKAARDRRKKGK
jgi:hypothetical protein